MDLRMKLKALLLSMQFRSRSNILLTLEESDEEYEEETVLLSLCELELKHRCEGRRTHALKLANYAEIIVPQFSEGVFRAHFRMTPGTAAELENKISPTLARQGPIGRHRIPPRKQILCILWLLATPDSYRSIGEQFAMSKSSLHHCFRRVIYALCDIVKDEISWPKGQEAEVEMEKFCRLAGMPNVIGAIDGCHMEIDAPKEDAAAYRTGKKKYAIQLQAVCTSDLLFTDIFSGYPGSVHDARVFRNSPLYRDSNQLIVGDEYIVGDKAFYPVLTWCIPPYKNHGDLTEAEIQFNKKLSITRQVIERCFCLLKGRFRRLKHLVMYRTDEIPYAITAACVLHNICLRGLHEHPDEIEEYIRDGQETVPNPDQEVGYADRSGAEAITKRDLIRDMVTNV